MKKLLNSLMLILSMCLSIVFSANTVVKAEDYGYTVTVFSGNQSTFTNASAIQIPAGAKVLSVSKNKIVITDIKYGSMLSISGQDAVTLDANSKYYVKGIRLSGRDNNTVAYSSFTVYEDQDYVVAYGIKGESTSYTVNYVDEAGTKLAESKTYYGNVGDEPVIAYLYLDGYSPSTYNVTKALVSDSAANVFDFVYVKNTKPDTSQSADNENVDNATTNDNSDSNNAVDNNDGDNNSSDNNASDNNATDNNSDNNADNSGDNTANNNADGNNNVADNNNAGNSNDEIGQVTNVGDAPNEAEAEPAPNNIIDDSDVPLNDNKNDKDHIDISEDKIPLAKLLFEDGLIFPIALGVIAIIVFVVGLLVIFKKKKKTTKGYSKIEVENLNKDDKN